MLDTLQRLRIATAFAGLLAAGGCDGAEDSPAAGAEAGAFPVSESGGKEDAFGRALIGVASPYAPDPRLAHQDAAAELNADMRKRREQAWRTAHQVLEPVPLLGLAEAAQMHAEVKLPSGEIPKVPRFETWYGIDDLKRMFQGLYGDLSPADRNAKTAFSGDSLAAIEEWNAAAQERSDRWPLQRYLEHVAKLGECDEGLDEEACAISLQSKFSGAAGGIARIAYSPGVAQHVLGNYGPILDCLENLDEIDPEEPPEDPQNFTHCFASEFGSSSVLVKAQWSRVGFGQKLPVFDTDAAALRTRLGPGSSADWGEHGDRKADPDSEQIYTIQLRNGAVFRLTGLHIMTKELRHWQWISMWWSDEPDRDFGADRPKELFEGLPAVWSNYKMCAVTAYAESDGDPAGRYPDMPSLAEALAASGQAGAPTWCSNPYIEHGRGNARTNCIGCHQHGGATVGEDLDGDGVFEDFDLNEVIRSETLYPSNGRIQQRETFVADYLWSFSRIDDFANVLRAEVEHVDNIDTHTVKSRTTSILELEGDDAVGGALFTTKCSACHGPAGMGTDFGPSLAQRVPMRDDEALLQSILLGRGNMPAWKDELTDLNLADIRAFLRATFQ